MSDLHPAPQPASFHRFGAVAVRLSVELGRTEMALRDVLMLGEGSTGRARPADRRNCSMSLPMAG